MRRLFLASIVAAATVVSFSIPALAKGPPVPTYTLALDCPAGTYAVIPAITLHDRTGTAVSDTWLECGLQDAITVTATAKAAAYSWTFWLCETSDASGSDIGGDLIPLAKGNKDTVAPCPIAGLEAISLTIVVNK